MRLPNLSFLLFNKIGNPPIWFVSKKNTFIHRVNQSIIFIILLFGSVYQKLQLFFYHPSAMNFYTINLVFCVTREIVGENILFAEKKLV